MALISPYPDVPVRQFKGNLHTHTTESDGPFAPQTTVDLYAARGYDFLMISDHDAVTDLAPLNAGGMTLLPGNEITAEGIHLLHVGAETPVKPVPNRQTILDAINEQGGFAIMNHPNWGYNFIHCTQEELERLTGYTGIEIYNGVTKRVEGSPLATDRWDMLLSKGRWVWGFGNDDCHHLCDYGVAWNMVFAKDASADSLIAAMRAGSFYVSTGVAIETIETRNHTILITSADTQSFRVVRDHGMVLDEIEGSELRYEVPLGEPLTYVRIECYGAGSRKAWTQPFRIT